MKQRGFNEFDLGASAYHEFGHIVLSGTGQDTEGHFNGTPPPSFDAYLCAMNPGGTPVLQGSCEREVRAVGRVGYGFTGPGYVGRPIVTTTTTGANLPYFPTPTATSIWSGIGGVELTFGLDFWNPAAEHLYNTTAKAYVPVSGDHPVHLSVDNGSWDIPFLPSDLSRPVVVWDPEHSAWWFFTRETSMSSGAKTSRIHVYRAQPGVYGYSDRGFLSHSSLRMETRYPVGAVWDPISTKIVLLWNSFEGNNFTEGSCADEFSEFSPPSAWLGHCRSEILAAVLDTDATSGMPVMAVQRFTDGPPTGAWGYNGLGSPTVVCDASATDSRQCEAYVVNQTQFKQIVNWRFCVNSSGGFCGYSSRSMERPSSPGETDFPIAVSPRRFDGSGVLLEAVTGGDRYIYYRSKANVQAAFPGWSALSIRTMSGPSVRRRLTSDIYTISYAQE